MLQYFIPLWDCFLNNGLSEYFIIIIVGFFVITVPILIRYLLRFD